MNCELDGLGPRVFLEAFGSRNVPETGNDMCTVLLVFFVEVHNVAQQIVWQQPRNIPIRRDWGTFKMKIIFQDVSVSEIFVSLIFRVERFHDMMLGRNFCYFFSNLDWTNTVFLKIRS